MSEGQDAPAEAWPAPIWEPPASGPEVAQVLASLDRMRVTFRWKADGLDAAGLATTVGASTLTLGGLLKHLALVEDDASCRRLSGARHPAVWRPYDPAVPDWEFVSAAQDSPDELYALYDDAVERSRALFAEAAERGLDQEIDLAFPDGQHLSLRRLLCDLIEEYSRHTGHADLIREVVDGRVGEDPPDGWRPVSGPGLWW